MEEQLVIVAKLITKVVLINIAVIILATEIIDFIQNNRKK
jgi:hypothetical protein